MRSYDVGVASLVIDAPAKWTDNLLSQHTVPDVMSVTNGVTRRISHAGLLRLAVTRELHATVGLSVAGALAAAGRLLEPANAGVIAIGHISVGIDLAALENRVQERLALALESAPRPRRGRPRKLGRRRLE